MDNKNRLWTEKLINSKICRNTKLNYEFDNKSVMNCIYPLRWLLTGIERKSPEFAGYNDGFF